MKDDLVKIVLELQHILDDQKMTKQERAYAMSLIMKLYTQTKQAKDDTTTNKNRGAVPQ